MLEWQIERPEGKPPEPPLDVLLHQPKFTESETAAAFVSAMQLRLLATGAGLPGGAADPSRAMPGSMMQTANLQDNTNNLPSVLSEDVREIANTEFQDKVPLHHADLSGYGLSTFSDWRKATPQGQKEPTGATQVRFDVVVGRTSYEVIQLKSRLWHPQARVVRTVIIERGNSGNVYRYDTGWVAISDGDCRRYAPIATGVVDSYRNIRNIRIVPKPLIVLSDTSTHVTWKWQEVLYDADLHLIPDPEGAREGQTVPIRDHTGYIQILPTNDVPEEPQFAELMNEVGRPIGGSAGCRCAAGRHARDAAVAPGGSARTPSHRDQGEVRARRQRRTVVGEGRPVDGCHDRRCDERRLGRRPPARPSGDPARERTRIRLPRCRRRVPN